MASSSLYLFKYNNYLNKILKKSDTLQGYGTPLVTLRNTNFNPNDYISTNHLFNTWTMDEKVIPDYCVVCDQSDVILSRWFVTGVRRTRGGQWSVTLLRDLAADHKEELLAATCFIQKGYTNSSPFVFNNENMGFNQILSDLIPITNRLNTPWLVLYLARYQAGSGGSEPSFNRFEGSFVDDPTTLQPDYVLESLSDYKYYAYQNRAYTAYDPDVIYFGAEYKYLGNGKGYEMTQQFIAGDSGFKSGIGDAYFDIPSGKTFPSVPTGAQLTGSRSNWQAMSGEFEVGLSSDSTGLPINSYTSNPVRLSYLDNPILPSNLGTIDGWNVLKAEGGKTIKVGDNFYRIKINETILDQGPGGVYKIPPDSGLGQVIQESFFYMNDIDVPSNAQRNFYVHTPITKPQLTVEFEPMESATFSYDIQYDKIVTRDSSYEIIAAPYNTITFSSIPDPGGSFRHNGDIALKWFQAIINKYNGANYAYDLQLVPYCPVDTLDLSTQDVVFCQSGDAKLALAIKLQTSNFSDTFQISRFPWNEDLKLSNELDLYRIVSPNGVGEYEWTPAKNGQSIGARPYFEVDCTLIPFQPYIKVNPDFGGLYGKDFNDYRGLICAGDFSLPIVNSEWETYKLNNKYYQSIFDRNIEHQEFNNKYALISDIVGAATGALGGASQGAIAGSMVAPGVGTVVGAVAGGALSAGGGIADVVINEKLRKENITYQKDQFGFELGTIKARSQSLTRTTSFNVNNKYFPYVEYYTCTPQEKQALLNKMKYNGMTIGVIGTIPDYLDPTNELTYIQGSIIEIDITADAAIVDRLNEILQGGIRINNG